jgi:sulfur carrier protein
VAPVHAGEVHVIITVNGQARDVAAGITVAQLVRCVTDQDKGIAVAVNGEVMPRREWPAAALADHDQVEVVTAVQGG